MKLFSTRALERQCSTRATTRRGFSEKIARSGGVKFVETIGQDKRPREALFDG